MTTTVTVKVDYNHPDTCVRVQHVLHLASGAKAVTTLMSIGAGQSWTGHIWDGQDVQLVEENLGQVKIVASETP